MQPRTNAETAAWLRSWVEEDRRREHGPFSWPTDGCSLEQHVAFCRHRNQHYEEVLEMEREDFRRFVLEYAERLEGQRP